MDSKVIDFVVSLAEKNIPGCRFSIGWLNSRLAEIATGPRKSFAGSCYVVLKVMFPFPTMIESHFARAFRMVPNSVRNYKARPKYKRGMEQCRKDFILAYTGRAAELWRQFSRHEIDADELRDFFYELVMLDQDLSRDIRLKLEYKALRGKLPPGLCQAMDEILEAVRGDAEHFRSADPGKVAIYAAELKRRTARLEDIPPNT